MKSIFVAAKALKLTFVAANVLDNGYVVSTIDHMNNLNGELTVVDKLRFLFDEFCSDSKVDYDKLAKVLNNSYSPLFTGSRTVDGGYTDVSDIDIVVAVKHSYCPLLSGGINITTDSDDELDKNGNKFYDDEEISDKDLENKSPVSTFRFGPINLILVHPESYEKWRLATNVISTLKMKKKRERVMIFQAIRHNKFVDIGVDSQQNNTVINHPVGTYDAFSTRSVSTRSVSPQVVTTRNENNTLNRTTAPTFSDTY